MISPVRSEFTSDSVSGRLGIRHETAPSAVTHFDIELDRNFGGIWPRLHIEVEHRDAAGSELLFNDNPVSREEAYPSGTALPYLVDQDLEVSRAVVESLLRCLNRLGVSGDVSLLRVDTSVETGTRFGEIVGVLAGVVISDYLSGNRPHFEETARTTINRY